MTMTRRNLDADDVDEPIVRHTGTATALPTTVDNALHYHRNQQYSIIGLTNSDEVQNNGFRKKVLREAYQTGEGARAYVEIQNMLCMAIELGTADCSSFRAKRDLDTI